VAATLLLSAVLAAMLLVRSARVTRHDVATVSGKDVRALALFWLPLLGANVFGIVAPRMDVMLLGYWASSVDVGRYLVAFQTASVLALVLGAFDVVFAPLMSRAWSTHDEVAMRDSYQAVHRMASMATMPIFVVVVVFREEVLALFGGATSEAATALFILAVGHLVNAMAGGSSTVLLMTGRSRTVLLNTIVYGLGLGFAAALMIPRWGSVGAAVAASAALVGVNFMRVWQVWQRHAVLPWTWQTVKPLAAGLAMGLLLWLAKPYVGLVWYIPLAGMGVAAYLTLLYALQLNEDDRVVMAATLGRLRPARS
jgi:O-antigen/teichoic acid export membrane protein